MCEFHFKINDFEVCDRDSELKEKGREYSDINRGVTDSDILPRNNVRVKQNRNKMTPTFRPEPKTVKANYGNSLTLDAYGLNTSGTLLMLRSSFKNMMTHRNAN